MNCEKSAPWTDDAGWQSAPSFVRVQSVNESKSESSLAEAAEPIVRTMVQT